MGVSRRKSPTKTAVASASKKDRVNNDQVLTQNMLTTPPRQTGRGRAAAAVKPVTPTAAKTSRNIENPSVTSAKALGIRDQVSAADYYGANGGKKDESDDEEERFDFGNSGIPYVPVVATKSGGADKDSTLKLAIVPGAALVWRFEPNDERNGSWAEKTMMDATKNRAKWIDYTHFSDRVYQWHVNNEKKTNSRGFGIRLFVINVNSTDINHSALRRLAEFIAKKINKTEGNNTVTVVGPGDTFICNHDATWAELIGNESALWHLKFETKVQSFTRGFYQEHQTKIHQHFRRGTFTVELACTLHAPLDCIDPALRRETTGTRGRSNPDPNVAHAHNFFMAPSFDNNDDADEVFDLNNDSDDNGGGGDDESIDEDVL